jgi:uncharacterized protein (TIGR02677 family)
MKYWMYKEEVFEELKKSEYFIEYTMDQCKQDLDSLVEWGNLIPVQDTAKASTVEEFKNKQFRYHLSEYSVEIERMTIRLENLKVESASLEPSLLERLRIELKKFKDMVDEDTNKVGNWWNSLNEDFKRLNQNYQDYIRDLYSLKAEEMMKTREFLVFKDMFIDYLRDFIKGLQQNSYAIEAILKELDIHQEERVLNKVFEYNKSIPRIDTEISLEVIRENINERWTNLKNWFLGDEQRESEAAKLFDITNEIIRKITRFAFQIVETRNSAANRKEEYKKLCEMFLNCKDINEAHRLSSLTFGIFNTKHIKGNIIRDSESINSGVYDERPYEVIIKPRVRTYREKRDRTPIANNSERKREMLEQVIWEREHERSVMESYIVNNQIDFANLPKIESHVRVALLRWLTKGSSAPNRTSKTEDGRVFKVILPEKDKNCILDCEDGKLQMPAYKIIFE